MTQFKPSRRGVLIAAGGATMLVAAGGSHANGGGGRRRFLRRRGLCAWRLWDEPRLRATPTALAAAAILAADPHDTQPWLFRVSDQTIELFADLSRHLGAMDPYCANCISASAARSRTLSSPPGRTATTPKSSRSRVR